MVFAELGKIGFVQHHRAVGGIVCIHHRLFIFIVLKAKPMSEFVKGVGIHVLWLFLHLDAQLGIPCHQAMEVIRRRRLCRGDHAMWKNP